MLQSFVLQILKNYNNVRNSENTKILSGAKLSIFPPKREAQHNFKSFFVRQVTEELYELYHMC